MQRYTSSATIQFWVQLINHNTLLHFKQISLLWGAMGESISRFKRILLCLLSQLNHIALHILYRPITLQRTFSKQLSDWKWRGDCAMFTFALFVLLMLAKCWCMRNYAILLLRQKTTVNKGKQGKNEWLSQSQAITLSNGGVSYEECLK